MKILAIETSCDETAVSIIRAEGEYPDTTITILGNVVLSQAQLHAEYGGVFPHLAKREHSRNLVPVFKKALEQAGFLNRRSTTVNLPTFQLANVQTILEREPALYEAFVEFIPKIEKPDIDLIAVTAGPGLEPALWTGINFAKALARVWDIPLAPVNHMEGHLLSSLLDQWRPGHGARMRSITFPALGLLISGGHTELVLMRDFLSYELLGSTRDDAVGEAFDKVARMMGLVYPGGPEISRYAVRGKENSDFVLPRPMLHSDDFDFSFSGIKTAVMYLLRERKKSLTEQGKADLAYAFETAVADVLAQKTLRAAEEYGARTLVLGGGVSANNAICNTLRAGAEKRLPQVAVLIPEAGLATDNALMIALAAYFRYAAAGTTPPHPETIRACGTLSLASRRSRRA